MILAGGHGERFRSAVSDDVDSNRAVIRFDVDTCHMLHHTSFIARITSQGTGVLISMIRQCVHLHVLHERLSR
jgi:hypothetical protein